MILGLVMFLNRAYWELKFFPFFYKLFIDSNDDYFNYFIQGEFKH